MDTSKAVNSLKCFLHRMLKCGMATTLPVCVGIARRSEEYGIGKRRGIEHDPCAIYMKWATKGWQRRRFPHVP